MKHGGWWHAAFLPSVMVALFPGTDAVAQDILARRGQNAYPIPPPVIVTVALVESFGEQFKGFDALVLRHRGGKDVILISRELTTVGALDTAMRVLLDSRLVLGIAPSQFAGRDFEVLELGVTVNEPCDPAWLAHYAQKIQAVLDSLVSPDAETKVVEGVGAVPALEVMPPELKQWLVPQQPPQAAGPRRVPWPTCERS